MSESQQKASADKIASLTEELSSILAIRAMLRTNLREMSMLVPRLKDDIGKSMSGVSMELQKSYEDAITAVKLNIREDLVDGWKRM